MNSLLRTPFRLIAVSAIGLLASVAAIRAQAPAATLDRFVGTWLVVPRMAPETVAPGSIPRAFVISKRGSSYEGMFESDAQQRVLSELAIRDGMLACKMTSWWGTADLLVELSGDGTQIEVWFRNKEGTAPFLARLVTASEFAAIKQAAPQPGKFEKLPLPTPHDVPSNALARTPPMGWNSWNVFRDAVNDRTIREMADALVSSGLRDAGYIYINIDDGWEGHRDAQGVLHPNEKFPDMKALADYVHARGLKFGIYSSPGPLTCAGYLGSHGHEEQDAKIFAGWGVDLLKYDWCSAGRIYESASDMKALYQKMGEALQATGRPIVYSLCQYGLHDVSSWGRQVGGNLWRTGGDSVEGNLWKAIDQRFEKNGRAEKAGPGGWNDADMMLIGLPGLTEDEYRTHLTLWAVSASPIILGNDLRTMTPAVKAILLNREVIAVDQDARGVQGRRAVQRGPAEIWTKPLADGSVAVAMFNRGDGPVEIEVNWPDLALGNVSAIRDLWQHLEVSVSKQSRVRLPSHGSALFRVSSK